MAMMAVAREEGASAARWDCRSFDAAAYRQSIMEERAESLGSCFDVVFLSHFAPSPSAAPADYIAVAHSSGQIRIFKVKDTMQRWVNRKASGTPCVTWDAHQGPVYSLTCLGSGSGSGSTGLLVSGGDDGWVKAWRLSEVLEACSRSGGGGGAAAAAALVPCWTCRLPRSDCIWGGTGRRPGVVCAAAGAAAAGRLCVGASDGGVHVLDLESPAASTSACGAAADAASATPLLSLSGHAASVLSMAVSCTGLLASGSEDGTVRLWDCRQANACTCAINPWDGVTLPLHSPAQLLQCVRGPYVSSVRFALEGGWLLMGTGNRALTLWSLPLGALVKQQNTPMVPQATAFVPGEILVAGSGPSLLRFRFSALDAEPTVLPLCTRSVFGMAVDPSSGLVAMSGAGGLDLISRHGAQLGAVWPGEADDWGAAPV